jgi:outer membrane protein assembly factor BamE (lipoprotein component of BamABCDE complex)
MRCRAALAVLVWAATAVLCGCIVVKQAGSPDPERRDNIDAHAGETFRAGVTTLEDVLLTLGEPAAAAADGRWLEYRNTHNLGHWSVWGCGVYTCGGFDTDDRIRQRTLTVYFDAAGRVGEIINADGPADLSPEQRLLTRHLQAVIETGEAVVERLPGAQRQVDDRWQPGVIVVTDRAIVFLEATHTGPAWRLALRLPAAEILSADWADDPLVPGAACARVRRVDGRSEAFRLMPLPGDPAAAAKRFDRGRTQGFIELVGWLPARGSRKAP